MKFGYCKLGRSINFDPNSWGFQGDQEAVNLLYRLAARNPEHEFIVVGRNSKDKTFPYSNITNPWSERPTGGAPGFADKLSVVMGTYDGLIVNVGQHGTSHQSIPFSKSTWAQYYDDPWTHATTPQDWATSYAGFLFKGMTTLCDRTNGQAKMAWIISDPRNFINARDIKWPTGLDDILAQYQYERDQRHERFRDPRTPEELGFGDWVKSDRDGEIWVAHHRYRYADLELMILPDDWYLWGNPDFAERRTIGVATTSFAVGAAGTKTGQRKDMRRSELVRDYVLAEHPEAEVYGKWDAASLKDVPDGTVIQNDPVDFPDLLARWRCTVALPALNTSWTVAKSYQCFAARTVCFHVGELDDQGWVIPSRRHAAGTHEIGDGLGLYSIRDDWTDEEIVLAQWLRVEDPDELNERVKVIDESPQTWAWLVNVQRRLLQRRWDAHYLESEIERKLGIAHVQDPS
jgi:hypothetical protein